MRARTVMGAVGMRLRSDVEVPPTGVPTAPPTRLPGTPTSHPIGRAVCLLRWSRRRDGDSLIWVKARGSPSPYRRRHEPHAAATPTEGTIMTTTATDSTRTILRAEGFSCPSCVAKVTKQVERLDGVDAVQVHFASAR